MGSKNNADEQKKGASENTLAYSQKIAALLNEADEMLLTAPQSIEVRGAVKYLKAAKGSLAQAGKFSEVKEKK